MNTKALKAHYELFITIMTRISLFYFMTIALLSTCALAQNSDTKPTFKTFEYSPSIDLKDESNMKVLQTFDAFIQSKDSMLYQNQYWKSSDFKKYRFPYLELYNSETNFQDTSEHYNPFILNLTQIEKNKSYILKFAYCGYNPNTKMSKVKFTFNIIAEVEGEQVFFSRYLNHVIKDWKTMTEGPITYHISPNKKVNEKEIAQQMEDIKKLDDFFQTTIENVHYYSCINPAEIFQLKGFDYNYYMHLHKTGGMVDYNNHVFSGNNSELYTHEISHIYISKLYPRINPFLNEGIATYLAGSGKYDYKWHKEKLQGYLKENPDFSFIKYTNIYKQDYIDDETPIAYMFGAIVVEYILKNYSKEKLFELANTQEQNFWKLIEPIGLNENNLIEKTMK